MTNAWLAIVTAPDRGAPEFCWTLYETAPLPFPLAFPLIEIQVAVVVAVHEHPGGATTARPPVPPPDGASRMPGCSSNRHAVACWVTRACASLTAISPS